MFDRSRSLTDMTHILVQIRRIRALKVLTKAQIGRLVARAGALILLLVLLSERTLFLDKLLLVLLCAKVDLMDRVNLLKVSQRVATELLNMA